LNSDKIWTIWKKGKLSVLSISYHYSTYFLFHNFNIFSLFNIAFFHVFHIFSQFSVPFFHIFYIFSLFNLIFYCIVHILSLFDLILFHNFHLFTNQLGFLPYFPYLFTIQFIFQIRKKSKLKSGMI
jgi:hypothetical protein